MIKPEYDLGEKSKVEEEPKSLHLSLKLQKKLFQALKFVLGLEYGIWSLDLGI